MVIRSTVVLLATLGLLAAAGCGDSDRGGGGPEHAGQGSVDKDAARTATTPKRATEATNAKRAKTVTGPARCPYKAGVVLAVHTGRIACSQAANVARSSSGPNSSTAPAGWDCSGFPKTLEGNDLTAADGKGCRRGDVTFSVYQASAGEGKAGGAQPASPSTGFDGPAVEAPSFKAPSGNIVCSGATGSLECVLNGAGPAYHASTTGRARQAAIDAPSTGDESEIPYGTLVSVGGVRCKVEARGVACRNTDGHGFFLSQESQRLF